MFELSHKQLIQKAKKITGLYKSSGGASIGDVGCALITMDGNVYRGTSVHACCGVGFCAEYGAIASMVSKGEYRIGKIVAVMSDGTILSPCGKCRELMYQVDRKNLETCVILEKDRSIKLKDLLPEPWQEKYKKRRP